MWQWLITGLAVIAAAAFLVRRLVRAARGTEPPDCAFCPHRRGGCQAQRPAPSCDRSAGEVAPPPRSGPVVRPPP